MSQTQTSKAAADDERTEAARSFVRTVKAAARRKYTPEEKIRIVLEGFRREVTVSDLCRREGIKPHSYYAWTKEFMEAGKERLTRDAVRDATQQEVHQAGYPAACTSSWATGSRCRFSRTDRLAPPAQPQRRGMTGIDAAGGAPNPSATGGASTDM